MTHDPIGTFQVAPAQNSFSILRKAILDRDYNQAIKFATATYNYIQQIALTVVDNRAYAYAMKGDFEAAIKDAHQMIGCSPTLAHGYLRLGSLYQMQGKPSLAVDAYDMGLECTMGTDADNFIRLLESRDDAISQSERCIDFVATLPMEIASRIIMLLPHETKCICLNVSKSWRRRIVDCPEAWSALTIDNCPNGVSKRLIKLLPDIGAHVKTLSGAHMDEGVWLKYLQSMRDGHFTGLKSLCLKVITGKQINANTLLAMSISLFQMRSTLTHLELQFKETYHTITVADALSTCPNLISLIYGTNFNVSTALGVPFSLEPHNALIDLQLKSSSITCRKIRPLLQQCQQLRRLVLNGCSDDILNVINRDNCPRLRILSCNRIGQQPLIPVDRLDLTESPYGLREISIGSRIFASATFTLLEAHAATLKAVFLCLSTGRYQDLNTVYRGAYLNQLEDLTFWGDSIPHMDSPPDILPVILQSISACTQLKRLNLMGTINIPPEIISRLPPVETLICTAITPSGDTNPLEQLLGYYGTRSGTASTCFRAICLDNCITVTCSELKTLATVTTLRDIALKEFTHITTSEMVAFLVLVRDNLSLTDITLDQCNINDTHLIILASMETLSNIHFRLLPKVTDHGIMRLVDSKSALKLLTIKECPAITRKSIEHAQKKVRVEYTT